MIAATVPTLDGGKADFPPGRGGADENKQNGRYDASLSTHRGASSQNDGKKRLRGDAAHVSASRVESVVTFVLMMAFNDICAADIKASVDQPLSSAGK